MGLFVFAERTLFLYMGAKRESGTLLSLRERCLPATTAQLLHLLGPKKGNAEFMPPYTHERKNPM